MSVTVSHVLINILEVPRAGDNAVLVRVRHEDKGKIDRAAELVGMKQAEFTRTACVRAAEKVIREVTGEE